jgi:DNA-binding NarL/FixJ family response regulator
MPYTRNLTPRLIEMAALYVDGKTVQEVADRCGVAPETVKSALVVTRQHLRAEGYKRLSTIIGLRRALRERGNLEHIKPI